MQKPTRVALHAQITQPVPAHRLTVILTTALVELRRRRLRLRIVRIELVFKVEIDVEIIVHRGLASHARAPTVRPGVAPKRF
jgi:ferredoxin-fold anticodon binding domain-containing protein